MFVFDISSEAIHFILLDRTTINKLTLKNTWGTLKVCLSAVEHLRACVCINVWFGPAGCMKNMFYACPPTPP